MTQYRVFTELTVTLEREFRVEADSVEQAQQQFEEGGEDNFINERVTRVVGDETVIHVEGLDDA